MKKFKYRISNKAIEDLEGIWVYTYKNWSVQQADRYYKLIIDEIEFVAKNFYSGKSMEHIKEGYRASLVKSHMIFYKIVNEEHIEIIRILHQMMDVESNLKD
jgi:toxin ParE1/3/4